MILSWKNFYSLGLEMVNNQVIDPNSTPNRNKDLEFRSQFGVSWFVCSNVWQLLEMNFPNRKREPKHLLWGLMFLKVYGSEKTHSSIAGCDVKTFRKWAWNVLQDISNLETIVVRVRKILLCSFACHPEKLKNFSLFLFKLYRLIGKSAKKMTKVMTAWCQLMASTFKLWNHILMKRNGPRDGTPKSLRGLHFGMRSACQSSTATLFGAMDLLHLDSGQIGKFLRRGDFFHILMRMKGSRLTMVILQATQNIARQEALFIILNPVRKSEM